MLASTVCFTANVLLIRAFDSYGGGNVWLLVCMRFVTGLLLITTLYHREFQRMNLVRHPRLIARGVIGDSARRPTTSQLFTSGLGAPLLSDTPTSSGAACWRCGFSMNA